MMACTGRVGWASWRRVLGHDAAGAEARDCPLHSAPTALVVGSCILKRCAGSAPDVISAVLAGSERSMLFAVAGLDLALPGRFPASAVPDRQAGLAAAAADLRRVPAPDRRPVLHEPSATARRAGQVTG